MSETAFGRFQLQGMLGSGPSGGETHRAFDPASDRVVAVKVLRQGLSDDAVRRLRRVVAAVSGLDEPHVAPVYESGVADGRLFVEMALIEGRDLGAVLAAAPGGLDAQRAVSVVEQLAAALDVAHRVGVVHGNVKPSNILGADHETIYLSDFGTPAGDSADLAYQAPEWRSTGSGDPRSDVYALACVLYECVTGQRWRAGGFDESGTGPLQPRPSGAGPAFDAVVARGVAHDPSRRFQSASALAEAARKALGGKGESPVPDPDSTSRTLAAAAPAERPDVPPERDRPVRRAQPWWRRRAGVLAAAAVSVIAVVATVLVVGLGDGKDAATASQTQSSSPPPIVDIDSLLLSADEFSAAMGVDGMIIDTTSEEPSSTPDKYTEPPACMTINLFASDVTFAGTGWAEMRRQSLVTKPASQFGRQAVVRLGSSERARSVVDDTERRWKSCEGEVIGARPHLIVGATTKSGDVVAVVAAVESQPSLTCEHAIAVRGDVVIEILTCGIGNGRAAAMVNKIIAMLDRPL